MSDMIKPAKVMRKHIIIHFKGHCIKVDAFSLFSDILDAILNFSKCSMMTGCHHPESLMAMSNLQESVKKKTLYHNSRSN